MKKLKDILVTPSMSEEEITEKIEKKLIEMGYDIRKHNSWGIGGGMDGKQKLIPPLCYADIIATRESTIYVFEVKKEKSKGGNLSTYIMQAVGQLLKYYYEVEGLTPSMKIKGIVIYCGSVNEKESYVVKATIKRFNLPIKLVVLERRE